MAKWSFLKGSTSQSDDIFIQDSSSTVGAGKTGLAFNTSGLTCYYTFLGANATATSVTLATLAAVNSAFSSGGFKEIDATNMPGHYRFDIPNAALASGNGRGVVFHLKGATNMADLAVAYELTGWDNQDGVRGGLTALPNAAANAAGGLPISAAGALDLDEMNVDIEAIQISTAGLTFTGAGKVDASVRDWIGGTIPAVNVTGVPLVDLKYTLGTISPAAAGSVGIDWAQVANKGSTVSLTATTIATLTTYTGNTPQTGDNYARLGAPAGASIAADLAEIEGETDTLLAGVTVTTNSDKTGYALTSGERNSVADAILDRDMSTGADSGSTTVRTMRQALRFLRNKWAIAAGTLTVYKEDDATSSWTSAVTTDGTAQPIVSNDPAGP